MFDLDQSISAWRAELARGGTCAGADLDELESHLRDSIVRLSAAGLSAEESFLIALRRLGRPDDLRPEYGKAHPERVWRDRAAWMLAGLLAWQAVSAISSLVDGTLSIGTAAAGVRGTALTWASLATDVLGLAVAVVLAVGLYRAVSQGRLPHRPGVWVAAGIAAIVLGRLGLELEKGVLFSLISPTEVGTMTLARSYLALALGILTPVMFGLLAMLLGRKGDVESC